MSDVSERVLQHLIKEPDILTAVTIEKSAQFVADDIGVPMLVAFDAINQLIKAGFIEFTKDGPVVHAVSQKTQRSKAATNNQKSPRHRQQGSNTKTGTDHTPGTNRNDRR